MFRGLKLSPDELGELARQMVEAQDSAEADRLKEEIVRGFYGGQALLTRMRQRHISYEQPPDE